MKRDIFFPSWWASSTKSTPLRCNRARRYRDHCNHIITWNKKTRGKYVAMINVKCFFCTGYGRVTLDSFGWIRDILADAARTQIQELTIWKRYSCECTETIQEIMNNIKRSIAWSQNGWSKGRNFLVFLKIILVYLRGTWFKNDQNVYLIKKSQANKVVHHSHFLPIRK